MWARIFEVSLALWLAVSPFVFRYDLDGDRFLWWNSFACAVAVMAFAFASYVPRFERIHAATVPIGAWLVLTAYTVAPPPPVPGAYQNFVLVGWLLLMFGVIPSRASTPPRAWEEWWRDRGPRTSSRPLPGPWVR